MISIELEELMARRDFRSIATELSKENPVDLAQLLGELEATDIAVVFRLIEKKLAAETFSYMDQEQRQILLETFSNKEIKAVLDEMFADDVVDTLEDMPSNVITSILDNIDEKTRARVNKLLQYDEFTVGSIMTTEFIELYPEMTVEEALLKIRRLGIHSETVYTCYVVEERHLIGIVTAKDLITNEPDVEIKDLMQEKFITVKTHDDKEDVANLFRKYGLIAIPAIDSEGCIVGIVTFDDAIDVLTEETTEDMHKMAAMTASDDTYLKTSVFEHAKHRIMWLLILMLSAAVTGALILKNDEIFQIMPMMIAFIPLLMDTGGNCGAQSSTLIIRGLAIGELKYSDFFKIVWKEFRVSLLISAVLASIGGLGIYFIMDNASLAIVVSISLVVTIVVAKLIGCILPVLAKKLKLDPAFMASPLISTIIDLCSMVIYFNIAYLLI